MKKAIPIFVAVFTMATAMFAKDCEVKMKSGEIKKFDKIASDASGNLLLMSGKFKTKIRKNQYIYAWIPIPKAIQAAAIKVKKQDYKTAIKILDKYQPQYKYLGWNVFMIFLRAKAEEGLGNKEAAVKLLEPLTSHQLLNPKNRKFLDESYQTLGSLYIETGKLDMGEKVFNKIAYAQDPETASFALNKLGDILLKKGKAKEAVLKYLQTVLLFKTKERAEALCKLANTLKTLNDNRSVKYASMLKKEYPGSPYVKELK
jgi:tetratricopeptide (TPR) repeat protein